ncbi:MAG: CBU_0592 family membrane protein [Longimicrobiales bacterium]
MAHEGAATIIGSAGVILLLIAFLLNLLKLLNSDGWTYLALNFVGAAVAGYSSYMIRFMPFLVLEGTWAAVALMGMMRKLATHDIRTSPYSSPEG